MSKKVTSIIPISVIETGSDEVTCANVLAYPNLLEDDFTTIDPKDYEWEEREFIAPLFSNKKPEEVFLIKTDITEEGFDMRIHEDEKLLKIAVKAFDDWQTHMDKVFEFLGNSKLFDKKLTTWEED